MKITVTTTTQTLRTIIDADANKAVINSLFQNGYVKVTIINNTANALHMDTGIVAVVANTSPIAASGGRRTFIVKDQRDINLITLVASGAIDIEFDIPESRV